MGGGIRDGEGMGGKRKCRLGWLGEREERESGEWEEKSKIEEGENK